MSLLVLFAASLVLGAPAQKRLERWLVSSELRPLRARARFARGLRPVPLTDRWLARPTPISPRFLDHGTLELALAGGTPHVYRLDLRTGLFDVASFGVTGHWLPGQAWPQIWPIGALALWRGRMFEVGAHYRPVLFPPVDRELTFTPRAHFMLASFTFGTDIFQAGLDLGAAHLRVAKADPALATTFDRQTLFGGGFVVRVGNEWIGASADALAAVGVQPLLVFEVKLDVRFDLAMVAGRHGTRQQVQVHPQQAHR
jgi:hypothetical protein